MTDVGGLNYTIRVKEDFHAAFQRFHDDMKQARKDFRQFKTDMRKGVAGAVDKARVGGRTKKEKQKVPLIATASGNIITLKQYDAAAKRAEQRQNQAKKRADSFAKEVEKRDKAAFKRLETFRVRAAKREKERIKLRQRSRTRAINQRIAQEKKFTRLALRNQAKLRREQQRALRAFRRSPVGKAARGLSKTGTGFGAAANRISFSFRRLIGIFAVFQAVRTIVSGFKTLITEAVQLGAKIETARLGLAAIFASTSNIRDEFGNLVTGVEAFNISTKIAAEQIRKLRLEGLKTSATFAQLLPAFQSAAAPGREAGLSPTQIRKLAVRIAQATAATGLPQNQLDEEIRSIIAGTATAKNTRIAQVLGGAREINRIVREAKKAGNLFEVLNDMLKQFAVAGEKAMDTFTGALSNAKDAMLLLVQTAATPFLNTTKELFKTIKDVALTENNKVLGLRPSLIRSMLPLFESLAGIVRDISNAFANESGIKGFGATFGAVGATLRVVSSVIIGVTKGINTTFALISGFLRTIVTAFSVAAEKILGIKVNGDLLSTTLSGVVEVLTEALALTILWNAALKLKGALLGIKKILLLVAASGPLLVAIIAFIASLEVLLRIFTKDHVGILGTISNIMDIILNKMRKQAGLARDTSSASDKWKGSLLNSRKTLEDNVALTKKLADNLKKATDTLAITRSGLSGTSLEILRARIQSEEQRRKALSKIDLTGLRVPKGKRLTRAETKQLADNITKANQEIRRINQTFRESLALTTQSILLRSKSAQKDAAVQATLKASLGLTELKPETPQQLQQLASIKKRLINAEFDAKERSIRQEIRDAKARKEKTTDLLRQAELSGILLGLDSRRAALENERAIALEKSKRAIAAEAKARREEAAQARADRFAFLAGKLGARQSVRQREAARGGALTAEEQAARLQNLEDVNADKTSLIVGGITEAFFQLQTDLPNIFNTIIETMKSIVTGFGDFVATTIVDAFDPTKDSTILERFGRFLQSLAKMIISQLVQIAVVKGLLGLGGLFRGGGGGTAQFANIASSIITGAPGAHDGGIIPGYATGGFPGRRRHPYPRPGNLHPSDTIPIYVAPGEAITRKRAVDTYGTKFMRAINEMKIDPSMARALVGNLTTSRLPATPKPGYVAGGEVVAPAQSSLGAGDTRPSGPAPAFIVANDQTAERLLSGGRNAFLTLVRENRDAVKQSLGLRRV